MKVTMKMIAEFKDLINTMEEVDMPIPNTDNAIDVADYFVFQFSDDNDIIEQFVNITKNETYNDEMVLEDIVAIAESFFIALPKSFLELIVIYFQEKHLQFQRGLKNQIETMSEAMIDRMQTLIGESIEPSANQESTQID